MHTKRARRVLGALTIAALVAASMTASSYSASGAKAKCPVKVLLIANLTGPQSANGQSVDAAVKAATTRINGQGGVLGCRIVVDVKDTGSDPTKDLPLAQEALSKSNYDLVFDSGFGGASVAPFTASKGVLYFMENGTANLADPKKYPYAFDWVPAGDWSAQAAANYAVKVRGLKKIAAINNNSTGGVAAAAAFKAMVEKGGGEVTTSELVPGNIVDTTPVLLRARNSGAQALFFNIFGTSAGYLLRDMDAIGWKVPVFGGQSPFGTDIASLVKPEVYANVLVAGPTPSTRPGNAATKNFVKELKAMGVKVSQSLFLYAMPWDAMMTFAWAANGAKSVDPAKVTHYLETHGRDRVPGLVMSPATNFRSHRHQVVVGPKSIAIARPAPLVDGQIPRVAYGVPR